MLDTLLQEGLARCSRPFALPGGGARIVTLQLGPGYVRGDRFECAGSVGAGAELHVAPQAAARAFGNGAESSAAAAWQVAAGATLRLVGEPLVLYAGARHRSTLDVELAPGAALAYLDVVAAHAAFAHAATRVRVRCGERLLVHDALALTPERLRGAVGSALYLRAGMSGDETRAALAAADAAAVNASARYGVRLGVGSPAGGGVFVRALGTAAAAGAVRTALLDVLAPAVALGGARAG